MRYPSSRPVPCATASALAATALVLASCGGDGGGDGPERMEEDDPSVPGAATIDPRYVSTSDTRPTLDALAAGLDPERALVPDSFECHDEDDPDTAVPDLLVTVGADGRYATGLGEGFVESLEEGGDVAFRGGPFDGEEIRVRFDDHGQSFEVEAGAADLACYQGGASAARAATRHRLDTPELADYACRDVESGGVETLELGADGRYAIAGDGGTFGVRGIVAGAPRVDFEGGPLDGESASYSAEAESGYRRFRVVTTTTIGVIPTGGSSELTLVCERVGEPAFFAEYGSEPAPPAPGTPVPLAGLYYTDDTLISPNDSYSRAAYFRFEPDGHVHTEVPHRAGLDCDRTRPNGLPYCDTYDVADGTLRVRSPLGEVRERALDHDGERVIEIDGEEAVPVGPVDAAALVGLWSDVAFSQIGLGCIGFQGFCSSTFTERELAFSDDGRFVRRSSNNSTSSSEGGLGGDFPSVYAFSSSDSSLVGRYAVDGNTLTLSYDNGRVVQEFVALPRPSTVALGELSYSREADD